MTVGCPSIEGVFGVWQEITAIFSFSKFKYLEELASYPRIKWNISVCWTSKGENDVLTSLFLYLVVFPSITLSLYTEQAFVIGLSAAVEYAYNKTVVIF